MGIIQVAKLSFSFASPIKGTSEPELIVLDEPSSTAKISNRGTLSKNKRAPEITLDEDEVKSKKYKPEIIEILDDDNHRNGKQSVRKLLFSF